MVPVGQISAQHARFVVQEQGGTVSKTTTRMRQLNRLATGVLALAIGSVSMVTTSASGSVASRAHIASRTSHGLAPACTTAGLVAWLERADAAAGTTRYALHLTNLSGHGCTLKGYPKVVAVDLSGRAVGYAAQNSQNEHSPNPVAVVLANNATATAMLAITDANNFPSTLCHLKMAAGIRVTPPNQSAAKVVPLPFGECTLKMPQILVIESVQRAPYSG